MGGRTLFPAHGRHHSPGAFPPVFLPGHHDCRPDAQFFTEWVTDLINETKTRKLASEADRQHLLDLYGQALAFYTQKSQNGCPAN